ncbi:hypothetical protein ACCO45_008895 [Purpureocillium lilacinum]|uniref:Uncharacterized protein n=1 Tax=Purpureocillium lilacinum TaxID=33203 RepID=A0ACC4DJL4_PURLI
MNPAKLWATRKISGLGRMQRKADALVELANLVLELVKIVSFKRAAANVDLLFDEDSKFTWGGRGINWTSQDAKEG